MKDREKINRGIALMLGMIMIAAIFAALPVATADVHNVPNNWTAVISADPLAGTSIYPGEQGVTFNVRILNDNPAGESDTANLNSANLDLASVGNAPITWVVSSDHTAGVNINNGASHSFGAFEFNVDADAEPGTYNMSVTISFDDSDGTPSDRQTLVVGYITYDIVPNIHVSDPAREYYAGESFVDMDVRVTDAWNGAHNLYLNITDVPSGIHFDQTTSWIPGPVNGQQLGFKIDIDNDMAPGIYPVEYQVQYFNNDGIWTTETGTFDITIGFTPVITAELTGSNMTINQGDESIPALGIRFTNNGNVDLRNIVVDLDYDGFFFFAPTSYYEGAAGSDEQNPIQQTEITIDSLAVGDSTDAEWYVALNPYVQAGQHKLLFSWSATYFDDGATNNPTSYVDVQMMWWDDDFNDATPLVPEIRFGLAPWQSPWVAGPYVMITVQDDHADFEASRMVNVATGDDYIWVSEDNLFNALIGTEITNMELIDFLDLKATLHVGPGTPFMNPLDHSATTVESDRALSDDNIRAGRTADVFWYVDIDPNVAPGTYTVEMTINARNADTTEYINSTIPVVVQVRGMGPILMISSVQNGKVAPGEIFYMNLTIENVGDDTARNVFVMVPGAFGSDWRVIDGFVDAISSYNKSDNEWGMADERNVSSNGITLEQLNINDAKDIVDLSLYIEGVYNPPSPEIWVLKTDNLAPGQNVTVSFKMMTNVNMVKGRPYEVDVFIGFTDSYGSNNGWIEPLTVRTDDPGMGYHDSSSFLYVSSSNGGLLMLFILFLIFIVLIVGLGMHKDSRGKPVKSTEPPQLMEEAPAEPLVESVEESSVAEPEINQEEVDVEPETEEIEPGFTLDEETADTETEPGFTLEEKEESSF